MLAHLGPHIYALICVWCIIGEIIRGIGKRYYRWGLWKYFPPATGNHTKWTHQTGTCRLQRQLWTPTWGLPLGGVHIWIRYRCGWSGGIISLFLQNKPHQLFMILHLMWHHLGHWVCHRIRVSCWFLGNTVWSRIFLLSIPRNLLVLGWENWSVWISEEQKRQALGLPRCLIQHWCI